MSKSLGNYIGIDEPAAQIFGKTMSVSDTLMWRYFELLSAKSLEEIAALRRGVEQGTRHPKAVKEELALELTALYHGAAAAEEARAGFNAVFAEGGDPDDAPEYRCAEGEDSTPAAFLAASGLAPSRSEARRLIAQKALHVNGAVRLDGAAPLGKGHYRIKLGKKRFLRLTVT
jgi:tyrosyl-tRNA synthetase